MNLREYERMRFFDIIHDILPWGRDLRAKLLELYDEPSLNWCPPEYELYNLREPLPQVSGEGDDEDQPPPTREAHEVKDPYGRLMSCMVCGERLTIDGRFCVKHYAGPSDLREF